VKGTHVQCLVCKHPHRLLMESLYLQGGIVSKIVDRFGGFTYPTFYRHCREGGISEEVQDNLGRQAELIERDIQQIVDSRDLPKGPEESDTLVDLIREFHEQTFNDAVRAEDALTKWEEYASDEAGNNKIKLTKLQRDKIQILNTIQGMKISAIKTLLASIEQKAIRDYLSRSDGSGDADKIENFDRLRTFVHLSNLAHKADDGSTQDTQVLPAKPVPVRD